jgi:hypothetical protein
MEDTPSEFGGAMAALYNDWCEAFDSIKEAD